MTADRMIEIIEDLGSVPLDLASKSSMPQFPRIVKTARLFLQLPKSELAKLSKDEIRTRFEDCYIKTFPEEIQKYCERIPMTTLLKETLLSSNEYNNPE